MLNVSDKLAYLVGKLPKTGTAAQVTRDTLKAMVQSGKYTATAKKAISQAFKQQGGVGAASLKGILNIAGGAAVTAYGANRIKKVAETGGKLNKEIKSYGEDYSKNQDDILAAVKLQGFKKRLREGKKLKKSEQEEIDYAKKYPKTIKTSP